MPTIRLVLPRFTRVRRQVYAATYSRHIANVNGGVFVPSNLRMFHVGMARALCRDIMTTQQTTAITSLNDRLYAAATKAGFVNALRAMQVEVTQVRADGGFMIAWDYEADERGVAVDYDVIDRAELWLAKVIGSAHVPQHVGIVDTSRLVVGAKVVVVRHEREYVGIVSSVLRQHDGCMHVWVRFGVYPRMIKIGVDGVAVGCELHFAQ